MAFVSGGVGVYFGPPVLGAPDDLEAVIVDFLDGAVHELDIAVQEIDSRTIAAAVIAAKQRHVRVRLILEGDYLVEAPALGDRWAVAGQLEEKRNIYNAMLRAGDAYASAGQALLRKLGRHLEDEEDLIIPLILDRGEGPLGVG